MKAKVIKVKGLTLSGDHFCFPNYFAHYERPFWDGDKVVLSVKVGKRRKLIRGRVKEIECYASQNSLADYLYEFIFCPNDLAKAISKIK